MAAFFPLNCNFPGSSEPGFTSIMELLESLDSHSRNEISRKNTKQCRRSPITTFQPKFDVRETHSTYELHGELAGMNKQDVHIEFTDPQTILVRGHIDRSYTTGTPSTITSSTPSTSETIENKEEQASSKSDDDNNSVKSHKATVEDDDEDYTEIATPNSEAKSSDEAAAKVVKPVVENNTVRTTTAEKPQTADTAKYWVSERSIGEFSRSFSFSQRVEHDGVTASLRDGILNITVPKAKKYEVRRISIL